MRSQILGFHYSNYLRVMRACLSCTHIPQKLFIYSQAIIFVFVEIYGHGGSTLNRLMHENKLLIIKRASPWGCKCHADISIQTHFFSALMIKEKNKCNKPRKKVSHLYSGDFLHLQSVWCQCCNTMETPKTAFSFGLLRLLTHSFLSSPLHMHTQHKW